MNALKKYLGIVWIALAAQLLIMQLVFLEEN
jgi:hypothetical protein